MQSADDPQPDEPSWEAIPGLAEPVDRVELDDLDLLADLTHPVRSRIVRRLKEPHSVAELAAMLDVPVTRLYHHVNRLENSGIIRVVATRRVGAATERRYRSTGKSYGIDSSLLESIDDDELSHAFGALFDIAKLGLQRWVESGGFRALRSRQLDGEHRSEADSEMLLSFGDLLLGPAGRAALLERLQQVIEECKSEPGGEHFTLFVAAHPEVV
jgi:DNA-binding transcriptional ArsR family regulator